ncbi:SlyX family protein [Aliiroseovarius sp. YM-037]|uniref:SlyX family protein n=1 Tax=Aliiroseovarius sp. YM-037 TaxID=3341728 RepID=UPI003A8062C1
MSEDRTHLEEQIAHLSRTVDDLSGVIARQEKDLSKLTKQVDMLMRREAEREYDSGGSVPLADQKPPHW